MSEGRSKFSLRFQASQTEAYFVAKNSERLLQQLFVASLVGLVTGGAILIYVLSSLLPRTPELGPLVIGMNVSVLALFGLIGVLTMTPRFIACLSPEIREVAVVFIVAYIMVACFMVDFFYAAKLLGYDPRALLGTTAFSDTRPLLGLSCVMTGTHLTMPIRWVVLLPLEVFSVLLYAACAFILGGPDGVAAWSSLVLYVGLVLISAMGRRAIERHERDEMLLLIQERSLRVATEHRLTCMEEVSQSRLPEDQLSTRESRPETTDSAQEFVKAADEGDLAGVAAIGRREQWMVDFKELKISPGCILGQGSFGKVIAGFYAGSPAAIKLTKAILCDDDGTNLNHNLLASLLNEIRIMRRLHHPNICSFYGASFDLQGSCVALVLEWVHGPSLEKFILRRGMNNHPLRLSDQFKAIMDTCSAVRYLHLQQPQIVHGDLKGTNIMIEENPSHPGSFRAKLLDFGLSRVLTRHARPLSGIAMWVAPEVVLFPGTPAKVYADVFSFGRLSFFVLTGRLPYETRSKQQILETIRSGSLPPLPWPEANSVLPDWRSWIENCSLQAADRRPCMDDVSLCIAKTLDKEDSKFVEAVWGLPMKAVRPLESFGLDSASAGLRASERPLAGEGPAEAQRAHALQSL